MRYSVVWCFLLVEAIFTISYDAINCNRSLIYFWTNICKLFIIYFHDLNYLMIRCILSVQYDTIICRTSRWLQIVTANKPVKQPDSPKCIGYGPVTVKIDGGLVWNQNDSDFCYMDNPEITNIYPHKTIKRFVLFAISLNKLWVLTSFTQKH